MLHGDEIMAMIVSLGFFGMILLITLTTLITRHVQKMAQIRANAGQNNNQEILAVIAAMRREMQQLRDTTTQYDMSFDSALQRLESRVDTLEGQTRHVEPEPQAAKLPGA